jgi:hypothetical protein
MSSETYPRKFTVGETVTIHGLTGVDAQHNGKEGTVARLPYIHPDNNRVTLNIRIHGAGLWALEPWHIKKTYLPAYDGNNVITWDDPMCVWKPDPNFRRFKDRHEDPDPGYEV